MQCLCPQKDIKEEFYSDLIHNNPELETTQMFFSSRMDK